MGFWELLFIGYWNNVILEAWANYPLFMLLAVAYLSCGIVLGYLTLRLFRVPLSK